MTSHRHQRRVECGRKVRHATKEIAQEEAVSLTHQYQRKFGAFQCRWCKQWHTGKRDVIDTLPRSRKLHKEAA